MTTESFLERSDRFLSEAILRSFLSREQAEGIRSQLSSRDTPASLLAVQQGLLSTVQADILETLLSRDQAIPGYEIIDVIGYGGMGVVYRARQKNLDRPVALKTILASQLGDPAALARFEQEAIAVARLRHPNIVAAYDLGRAGGRLYLAMELIEGESLEDRLARRGPMPESVAWAIARQAAAGLAHASHSGIVHRDVKPANLLLIPPPEGIPLPPDVPMVKIADFGLALLAAEGEARTRLTLAGSALGTPAYLAPEQITESDVDHRVDIYALGGTAYHMLSGEAPFGGQSVARLIAAKIAGAAIDLRALEGAVSPDSLALLAAMTAPRREERIGDYDTLLERIDRIGRTGPVPTKAPAAALTELLDTSDIQSPPRRPKGRTWAAAALILVAVAASATFLAQWIGRLPADPAPREMVERRIFPLFDGESLGAWRTQDGQWGPRKDEEGASVLGGRGAVLRPLPSANGHLGPFYAISLLVDRKEAASAEVRFAYVKDGDRERFFSLALSEAGATLRAAASDDPDGRVLAGPVPSPPRGDVLYRELRIERQMDRFFVFVDGRVAATTPAPLEPEQPQLVLAAQGGVATFGDIAFLVLAPKEPAAP